MMGTLWFYIFIYYLITVVGAFFLPEPSNKNPLSMGVVWCYVGWIPVLLITLLFENSIFMSQWHFSGINVSNEWKEFRGDLR